ncbi:MAG TPA: hypothetical protein VFK40_07850 [Nitrososphaeraceae archaeon]|nr:hypothetical protein [Nitrososphaeraceae archaeon]
MKDAVIIPKDNFFRMQKTLQCTLDEMDKVLSVAPEDPENLPFIINELEKNSKNKYYETSDIEKEIIYFISTNPGTIQTDIVNFISFSDATKFKYIKKTESRQTALKYIGNLLKVNIIRCEKDNANKSHYYINKSESLTELINFLLLFKKDYSELIVKLETKDIENISNHYTKILNKKFYNDDLIQVLFIPFKILLYISQFILMFNHSNYPRSSISIFKSIIFDTIEQIRNQLWSSSIIQKLGDFEVIYFIFIDPIKNIPDNINEMLQIMKVCNLDKEIELVMNNLWNICLPYLHFIHPFFSRFSAAKLQNWKAVMSEYELSIYSKKLPNRLGYDYMTG